MERALPRQTDDGGRVRDTETNRQKEVESEIQRQTDRRRDGGRVRDTETNRQKERWR